jgi:hypothetical protein
MGKINVKGGGLQVVQYRTASGRKSSRLDAFQSEDLEVNDTGDQLYVDFCFFDCGPPSSGPANVLPGDRAAADGRGYHGICLYVWHNDQLVYAKNTDGTSC